VLSVLTQAQLARVIFPLGELTKRAVRQIAKDKKLPVAAKPDSQDLCFVSEGDYRQFLARHAPPDSIRPGPIRDVSGKVIGQHQGLPFYTVGQRKGLGVGKQEAMYVLALVPAENALIVGTAAELGRADCTVQYVNYISGQAPPEPFRAAVKIRYTASEVDAIVTPLNSDAAHIKFDHPLRDITPGQAAVFYTGNSVIGQGIITADRQA
jgi:tRNA-specific 2-thiouridylase